jgi:chaperone required for assembly of F1-ATPase
MRDLFETIPLDDPITAARRGGRPALRRRFYAKATIASGAAGEVVCLDDKPIHTPARRVLAAPTAILAAAIAAEWEAARELIDPAKMPLTRLANAVIDGVVGASGSVAADVEKYLASDLLFYRASSPQGLRECQARHWDPIVAWAHDDLGADFKVGEGIVHVAQPRGALKAAAAAIPAEPWRLGAVHVVTTLTGSALIALAMSHRRLSADVAWQAAHVDEDWNMEQWGKDEMALERRSFHFTELQAAATVLGLLPG